LLQKSAKVRDAPEEQGPKIWCKPMKTKEWSEANEKTQHSLRRISAELSVSTVAKDLHTPVVHHFRTILSRIDLIKEEIRRIEPRLREIVVIERERWK
jgi:hypothetical protein